jgi:polar amino acid transport system ATP-binding protein
MKSEPQVDQRPGGGLSKQSQSGNQQTALRVAGLTKKFQNHVALNGVEFSVGQGEVTAIIGPSGSGKTTLLRCIALLALPDVGTIDLFGHPVFDGRSLGSDGHATALRALHHETLARVGVVFQSLNLWPHRTVLQNVADPLVRVRGVSRKEADAKAALQLGELGLSGKLSRSPDTLSGGERQRVALARALVGQPELLLLDEITSALDLERVAELLVLLRRLAKSAITLVLVTHELSFAAEVAQQVVFMDEGCVVETGQPQQVLTNPRSARVREFMSRIGEGFSTTFNNRITT